MKSNRSLAKGSNASPLISAFDQQVWGLIDYAKACERQLQLVDDVASGRKQETLVFCTHPPVVTMGRTTPGTDLIGWSGRVVETSRGGRATYHGPNQLVIYPVVDLRREDRPGLRERNVGGYIRLLGETVTMLLQELGASVELRQGSDTDEQGHTRQLTGIWSGERKVASIGVAVRKWITYHGVAINLSEDSQAFSGIRPCGFKPGTMISLQELVDKKVSADQLSQRFATLFEQSLHRS